MVLAVLHAVRGGTTGVALGSSSPEVGTGWPTGENLRSRSAARATSSSARSAKPLLAVRRTSSPSGSMGAGTEVPTLAILRRLAFRTGTLQASQGTEREPAVVSVAFSAVDPVGARPILTKFARVGSKCTPRSALLPQLGVA